MLAFLLTICYCFMICLLESTVTNTDVFMRFWDLLKEELIFYFSPFLNKINKCLKKIL